MQLFIDTANIEQIKEAISWGIVDGITTNPSLIKKEVERLKAAGQPVDMAQHLRTILQLAGEGVPVSLEVTATDAAGMATQGKALYQQFNGVAQNVVIKVPVNTYAGSNYEGLKAMKLLADAEIPINATLIFTPEQALLAAKAGASYVSPFTGRVDDHIRTMAGTEFTKEEYFPQDGLVAETEDGDEDTWDDNGILSGVDLVTKIADIFEKHEVDCDIIAASIRNPRQAREVALAGATIATIPFKVISDMTLHAKTQEGMQKFMADVVPEYQALVGGQTAPTQPAQPVQPQPTQPASQQPPQQSGYQPRFTQQQQPSAYDLARRQQGQ